MLEASLLKVTEETPCEGPRRGPRTEAPGLMATGARRRPGSQPWARERQEGGWPPAIPPADSWAPCTPQALPRPFLFRVQPSGPQCVGDTGAPAERHTVWCWQPLPGRGSAGLLARPVPTAVAAPAGRRDKWRSSSTRREWRPPVRLPRHLTFTETAASACF